MQGQVLRRSRSWPIKGPDGAGLHRAVIQLRRFRERWRNRTRHSSSEVARLIRQSIVTKLLVLVVMFAVVPLILYDQFQEAYRANQELLLQSVQQQGRLIVRAIEPILHEPGDESGKSIPVRLNATVERLAQSDVRIRALFRPANVVGVKGFYYVAAAPATSSDFLEHERREFIRQGILERLAPACDGGIERALRYSNPAGTDELVTSIVPVTTKAGCWIIVASHSTTEFEGSAIGLPFWSTPEIRTAAIFYGLLAFVTLSVFAGVWSSLWRFGRLARGIRTRTEDGWTFRQHNRIPELNGVASAFDDMVHTLQESARAIRRAAEDNAHAFKTPIAVIRQSFEPLSRSVSADDARGRRALEMIDTATNRLDILVSVARSMDEAEAEIIDPTFERIDISRMLARLLDQYSEIAWDRGLRLETDVVDGVTIVGSESLLEMVVENLVENAMSFLPPDGEINVRLRRESRTVVLTVEDNGPGVTESNLERIFERYCSIRSEQHKAKNAHGSQHMGIGLWVVKRHIEAMGGTVIADNRAQGGLRMTVTLPVMHRS